MENKTGTEALEGKSKPKEGSAKKEKPEAKGKEKGKKKAGKGGKRLVGMHTKRNDDDSFTHTHEYENEDGTPDFKQPTYSSSDMDDLHDHMDQHFGGAQDAGADPSEDPGANDDPGAAAAAPMPGA